MGKVVLVSSICHSKGNITEILVQRRLFFQGGLGPFVRGAGCRERRDCSDLYTISYIVDLRMYVYDLLCTVLIHSLCMLPYPSLALSY